jgi:uncharacterized protein YggE
MSENLYGKTKLVLMAVVIVSLLALIPTALKWGNSLYPSRTVTVNAEGKTTISPDIAYVSFSVLTEGSNPVKIEEDNAKKMTDAINFVKEQGIDSKDIATTSYNLSPRYEYDKEKRTTHISGYTLTQTANLKIRDFKKVAPILGGLSESGVNQIGSVTFSVEDPDKYITPARDEAFTKAQAKAREMAAKNGVKLGRVLNFSDYSGETPRPYQTYSLEAKGGGVSQTSFAPPIEPGTQELTVQVSVTYELEY